MNRGFARSQSSEGDESYLCSFAQPHPAFRHGDLAVPQHYSHTRRSSLFLQFARLLTTVAIAATAVSGTNRRLDQFGGPQFASVCNAEQPPQTPPKKNALLIAVTSYEAKSMNEPLPLQFPEKDAKALADVLRPSGYVVELLLGPKATKNNILDALEKLAKQGNNEGIVLVGLFGHGVEYEIKTASFESFFCPFDVSIRKRLENGKEVFGRDERPLFEPDPRQCVSIARVFEALAMSKAGQRALIADCCRNDPHTARAFGAKIGVADFHNKKNTAAFFACSSGQKAWEDPDASHGVFTDALLKAIKAHRAPQPLTMNELGMVVTPVVQARVAKLNGKSQIPHPIVSGIVDLMIQPAAIEQQLQAGPANQPQQPQRQQLPKPLRAGQVFKVRSVIGPGILFSSNTGNEQAGKAMVFDVNEEIVLLADMNSQRVHIANRIADGVGTRRGWLAAELIYMHLELPMTPTRMETLRRGGPAAEGPPVAKVKLTSRGQPLSNRTVTVYMVIGTQRQRLANPSTSNDGTVTLPLIGARQGMTIIVEFPGDQEFQASETSFLVE